MKPAAIRLLITAVLFVGWIGYLAYLVAATSQPIVLSRPQLQVSDFDVIATQSSGDSFVVGEVLYPAAKNDEWKGKSIVVVNLDKCQTFTSEGWHAVPPGSGPLLLPLQAAGSAQDGAAKFKVVPIPASPGYRPDSRQTGAATGPPRIYPDNAAMRRQYHAIQKP